VKNFAIIARPLHIDVYVSIRYFHNALHSVWDFVVYFFLFLPPIFVFIQHFNHYFCWLVTVLS
jgi:hypothetical protein